MGGGEGSGGVGWGPEQGCHCWELAAEAAGGLRLGHTCKSFGPKLFIWFLLSATSVSSVRLCPLSLKRRREKKKEKRNIHPTAAPLRPPVHVPLGDTRNRHDHQQNQGPREPRGHLQPCHPSNPPHPRLLHAALQQSSDSGERKNRAVICPLFLVLHHHFP